jgi:uncharacterized protein (TIGR02996 family)
LILFIRGEIRVIRVPSLGLEHTAVKHDKSGFWKAICANPDDDTPRLVFADFLEERGETARAEFIRAQCEAERLEHDDPHRVELEARAAALLQEHRAAWLEELPKWAASEKVVFRRGFPAALRTSGNKVMRNASALARRTVVNDLFLQSLSLRDAESIAASPLPPRLRTLGTMYPESTALAPLLAPMTGLTGVDLTNSRLWDGRLRVADFRQLLTPDTVRRLARFTLHETAGARPTISTLVATPFESLREFTLGGRGFDSADLDRVLQAPFVPALTALRLHYPLSREALELVAGSDALRGLRELEVEVADQGGPGFAAVVNSPHLENVTALGVVGINTTDCLKALAEAPMSGRLRKLHLSESTRNDVDPRASSALQNLLGSGCLRNLVRLTLSLSWENAVPILTGGAGLPELRRLDIDSHATDADLDALAECPHLPRLRVVRVRGLFRYGRADDPKLLRELNAKYGRRFAVLGEYYY